MRRKLSANQIETSFLDLQIHCTNEAVSSPLALGGGILSGQGGLEGDAGRRSITTFACTDHSNPHQETTCENPSFFT